MKEVLSSRNHRHRQTLGPRPVHHVDQWNSLVHLSMDHQGSVMQYRCNGGNLKPRCSRSDQNQLFYNPCLCQCLRSMAGNKRTERKTGDSQRTLRSEV